MQQGWPCRVRGGCDVSAWNGPETAGLMKARLHAQRELVPAEVVELLLGSQLLRSVLGEVTLPVSQVRTWVKKYQILSAYDT